MLDVRARSNRETAGFLASAVFVGLASLRDVYFGGLFQRIEPLAVSAIAFVLCSLVFLPVAVATDRDGLRVLLHRPRSLVAINASTAIAWIAFFQALRLVEPLLVQILFSGVGPLCVAFLIPEVGGVSLDPAERRVRFGLLAVITMAAAIVMGGASGAGPQRASTAALAVVLAIAAGVSISISTVLCRQMNDAGVGPTALIAVRFPGAAVLAIGLGAMWRVDFTTVLSGNVLGAVVGASLLLIVFPVYVNQIGIALASPFTVRVVLAVAPVLIFGLQLLEGRLSASPYSLACAVLYGVVALFAAAARHRAIRAAAHA